MHCSWQFYLLLLIACKSGKKDSKEGIEEVKFCSYENLKGKNKCKDTLHSPFGAKKSDSM